MFLFFTAWHRLATTYYNLVMNDRQNKFGADQQNFSPNNLSNLAIGFSLQNLQPPIAVNNMNVSTVANDALLAQFHHHQQAAFLQGFL